MYRAAGLVVPGRDPQEPRVVQRHGRRGAADEEEGAEVELAAVDQQRLNLA